MIILFESKFPKLQGSMQEQKACFSFSLTKFFSFLNSHSYKKDFSMLKKD